jgi:hypothetical protein
MLEKGEFSYPVQYVHCTDCGRDWGYSVERWKDDSPLCACKEVKPEPSGRYRRSRNAQVGADEAAAVAVNEKTGEVVYCFANPSDPLPERYAAAGFKKEQFHSLASLRSFCKQRGLVNDIEYDNPHDGYTEEQQRAEAERERNRDSKYQRAREEAAREMGIDPRTLQRRS